MKKMNGLWVKCFHCEQCKHHKKIDNEIYCKIKMDVCIFEYEDNVSCSECINEYLYEEVKTKPRIALINTPEELDKAVYEKWECLPDEVERKTFVNWLKEEVEE